MLFLMDKENKDKILDEYYFKLTNILIFAQIFLFIIFLIFLLPTYLNMLLDENSFRLKIKPLENEIKNNKEIIQKNNVNDINNSISILANPLHNNILNIYSEIENIYKEIPNVKLMAINIDVLNKTVSIDALVDNKNTANLLVEKLNTTKYKGAELPYSVFSQNKNFIFNQSLKYE